MQFIIFLSYFLQLKKIQNVFYINQLGFNLTPFITNEETFGLLVFNSLFNIEVIYRSVQYIEYTTDLSQVT